jgi:hypothetical protein
MIDHSRTHESVPSRHRVALPTAILACVVCAAVAGAGGAIAGATAPLTGASVQPGPPFVISGYGYTCQSTSRTPNFSCDYGKPYRPAGTPILTISKGSRTMYIQSFRRPTLSEADGVFTTKITR